MDFMWIKASQLISPHKISGYINHPFALQGGEAQQNDRHFTKEIPSATIQRVYLPSGSSTAMENGPFVEGLPVKHGHFP